MIMTVPALDAVFLCGDDVSPPKSFAHGDSFPTPTVAFEVDVIIIIRYNLVKVLM